MICASYTRECSLFGELIPISEQNEKIAAFLKNRRMRVERKFSDRKVDCSADEGFEEMKEAGINREFDCIVFWSLICFGKDPMIGYNLLLHTFLPAGIEFAVVRDNFFSMGQPEEEIKSYLHGLCKERRTTHNQSIKTLADEGRMNTLYGYEKHGMEFEIDPVSASVVQSIFKLALQQKTAKEITTELNEQNVESAHHYLNRVAGRDITDIPFAWDIPSVKKILTDTRYKGVRTLTRNGAVITQAMPSYITESEFDSIQTLFRHPKPKPKWDNPLQKKVFDKQTHIKLYVGDYMKNGSRDFYLSQRPENGEAYQKKVISAEEVLNSVRNQLMEEKTLAVRANHARTTEAGIAEYRKRKNELLQKAQKAFEDLIKKVVQSEELSPMAQSECLRLDRTFSELQQEISKLDVAFGERNPWITLYESMEIPEALTADFCKKYVEEVLIEQFERIEFVPKNMEWKQLLPDYWMEGQYGQKKQKE